VDYLAPKLTGELLTLQARINTEKLQKLSAADQLTGPVSSVPK
jgi:hypothetical protein